jgi:L-arabinokinase
MYIAVGAFAASVLLPLLLPRLMPRLWPVERNISRPRCFYYVTGHGFGHAARSVVVIEALLGAGYEVQVVTAVPASFFRRSLPGASLVVHSRKLDSGAFQATALEVDPLKSLDMYKSTIHDNYDDILTYEIDFLLKAKAQIVVTDATPLACTAGKRAGAKVVILSNFCWDFIYTEMCASLGHGGGSQGPYTRMIERVTADYSHADAMILYPGFNTPLGAYRQIQAPLIARLASRGRGAVRGALGIPADTKVLLLGFGGHSTAWSLEDSFLPLGWVCLVLSSKQSDMPSGDRFIALDPDVYAPDYVGAADVWIGKLGFGSVSEALAHAVPLVYIPRSSWPEEVYLEKYMLEMGGGIAMPEATFFSGNWSAHLERAVQKKSQLSPVDTNGSAQQIVNIIDSLLM